MKMRRFIGLLLGLTLCVTVSACGSTSAPSAQSYLQTAQAHIEKGEFDQAAAVLQEGFSATGDMQLISLMEQVAQGKQLAEEEREKQEAEQTQGAVSEQEEYEESEDPLDEQEPEPAFDIYEYLGEWIESDFCYDYGGMSLNIAKVGSGTAPRYSFKLDFIQGAPACRDAEVMVIVSESELLAETTLTFTEVDSWGTQGDFALTFENGEIQCRVTNTEYVYDDIPVWGVVDGSWTLQRGDISEAYEQRTIDPTAYEGEWYTEDPFGPGMYIGCMIDGNQLMLELSYHEGFDESGEFWEPINPVEVSYSVPMDSIVAGVIEFTAQDSCGNWADYTLLLESDDVWGEVVTCYVENYSYSGQAAIPNGEYLLNNGATDPY